MKIGVIPARLKSTRFPRKILAPINNRPMIAHVFDRASQSKELDEVVVAVDSKETVDALKPLKIPTVMTDPDLSSGTDRVFAAVKDRNVDIIINIQGDEPLIEPKLIDSLVRTFEDPSVEMVTAAYPKLSLKEIVNPNIVKVILDVNQNAAAFKREIEQGEIGACYRHVGIYGYRRNILERFVNLPQCEGEKLYKLEQLRALENGHPIRVILSPYSPIAVDTKEDLETVLEIIENLKS